MRIRGHKPTLKQSIIIKKNGYNPEDWLVKKTYPDHLEIIHRVNGKPRKAFYEVTK